VSGAAKRAALDAMLAIVREYDLDALTVRVGDATYELVARPETTLVAPASAPVPMPAAPAQPAEALMRPAAGPGAKRILAPIIGVFYNAPAPGAEPFVNVGDRVVVGQVLCILEAMKLMNEITSDYAGVVRRILPENGTLVSLGEEMFWIEP
jgi:acetyl-CoA carboxylase biotin carboxyl carrier protein